MTPSSNCLFGIYPRSENKAFIQPLALGLTGNADYSLDQREFNTRILLACLETTCMADSKAPDSLVTLTTVPEVKPGDRSTNYGPRKRKCKSDNLFSSKGQSKEKGPVSQNLTSQVGEAYGLWSIASLATDLRTVFAIDLTLAGLWIYQSTLAFLPCFPLALAWRVLSTDL